jgi:UDP-N-acetylmuramyl pentapeptide synthase
VHVVADEHGAIDVIVALAQPGDAVLVKASRAVGLEVVADALLAPAPDGATRGARP